MRFERYECYKDSEVAWLGEIPYEWEVKRVKDIFKLVTNVAPKNNNMRLLSIFASIGVKPRDEMEQKGNKSVTTDNYWIVKKGDFIVNKLLAWMGAIGLSNYNGVTSPAYDILRNKINISLKYYEYLFRMELSQAEFKRHSRGIMDVRLRLYFDKFGAISVPIQNLKTQQKIAIYLDNQTHKIDKEINLLKDKIEKYKELKQTLINETVLRGIDNGVELKDSRVEWIGKIPIDWEIKRIKDEVIPFNGGAFKEGLSDNGLPIIKIKQLVSKVKAIEFCKPSFYKVNKQNLLKSGDLVFSWSTLIYPFIYEGEDAVLNQHIFKLVYSRNIDKKFLYYTLVSSEDRLMVFAHGSTMKHILKSDFDNLEILFPPLKEQIQIANYLDEKTQKIDNITQTISKKIELLKEFRKTLVNDVVTGRVKVE